VQLNVAPHENSTLPLSTEVKVKIISLAEMICAFPSLSR